MYTITKRNFSNGLPSRIKVGPFTYQVILETDPSVPGSAEGTRVPVYGMVNFRRTQITIADDLASPVAWQCLLHELIHILFEHMGLEEPGEGMVDSMAYLLLGFMLDNGFLEEDPFPVERPFPAMETLKPERKEASRYVHPD